jgi:hypothetical protein
MRNAYKILVGKTDGKRHPGSPRRRGVDIRTELREIWWEILEWIHVT